MMILMLISLSIGISSLAEQANSYQLANPPNETHLNMMKHQYDHPAISDNRQESLVQATQSSLSNIPINVQQQPPSQLLQPPASKLVQPQLGGPIDGPKPKRLTLIGGRVEEEEEEDGFIMDSSARNGSTSDTSTEVTPTDSIATTLDPDQGIAIDVNRQQFVTHDQLLNASTKDESIPLQVQLPTATQSSRAGMSKVSHVSSFLSGEFF